MPRWPAGRPLANCTAQVQSISGPVRHPEPRNPNRCTILIRQPPSRYVSTVGTEQARTAAVLRCCAIEFKKARCGAYWADLCELPGPLAILITMQLVSYWIGTPSALSCQCVRLRGVPLAARGECVELAVPCLAVVDRWERMVRNASVTCLTGPGQPVLIRACP
jgi:hypothetical protein